MDDQNLDAPPTIDDVRAAADRLDGFAVRTPLLEAPLLNRFAGRRVLVKAECLQRTGSFKYRGARNALSTFSDAERARGALAFSSGNHAQGVAAAAAELGIPATIVMPSDAPRLKRANTEAYGAEVIEYERAGRESREEIGRRLIAERSCRLVRPYDDPLVIAGQGSVGLEIAAQARAAGVTEAEVLVCCGGGGLSAGVALALEAEAPDMRVRTVEPAGFDDWARSLVAGSRQRNDAMTGSVCDAILTPEPGVLTWEIGRRLFGPGMVVTDAQARRAMGVAFERMKLTLEPGGAVSLAAALFQAEGVKSDTVIVVASGGNVDRAVFVEALALR